MEEKYFKAIDNLFSCKGTPQLCGIKLYDDYWKTAFYKSQEKLNDVAISKENCKHFSEYKESIEFLNAHFDYMMGERARNGFEPIIHLYLWINIPNEILDKVKEYILKKIKYIHKESVTDYDGSIFTRVYDFDYEMNVGDNCMNSIYGTNLYISLTDRSYTNYFIGIDNEEELEESFLKFSQKEISDDPLCVIKKVIIDKKSLIERVFPNSDNVDIMAYLEYFFSQHIYYDPKYRKDKTFKQIWEDYNDEYWCHYYNMTKH